MSPIRRKIKKAAESIDAQSTEAEPIDAEPIGVEPVDAEFADAEPRITGDEVALLIVFLIFLLVASVAVLSWLGLPGEYGGFVFMIIVVFLGVSRLRRPATEKEPNPTFDPRIA